MGVTRTRTETIADVWADNFGGVSIAAGTGQVQLTIAEAMQHRDELDKALDRALEWSGGTAATAAETRTR
jgi:hypothetical protein